ncbi:MAG: alanine--tRNA ligase, partial [Geminicoccaceae bacterium]|nr:alanine--tRNA ligase [Geminicoccaceae bacterium]
VLRRIMRRGMRHAHLLGARDPLMHRLVPVLVAEMGGAFPELRRAEASIVEWLKLEETNFRRTLERGLRLLDEETRTLPAGGALPGETAFRLYDTFGFPLDLTQDALRAQGRAVDTAGFEAAMERQRAEARRHWKGSGEASVEALWFDLRERLGGTEFLGYATEEADARVLAIVVDGAEVRRAEAGATIGFVVNQTPFYGESGGQIGDTGRATGEHCRLRVTDTLKKLGDLWVHRAVVEEGTLEVGTALHLEVEGERRAALRRAHTATHLLHAALRRRLGDHVAQKGSLVAPDRLRFDFAQPRPPTAEDIAHVEAEVNFFLRRNEECAVRVMARDEAVEAGAMALFGEKYGDEVRVVTVGRDAGGRTYSMELCGGTHVGRAGDIALFKITGESAVASGVRRIEALTGEAALAHVADEERLLDEAAGLLKVPPGELPQRLRTMLDDRRRMEHELADLRRRLATGGGGTGEAGSRKVGTIAFTGRTIEGLPAKELRSAADALRKEMAEGGVVALVAVNDGKAALVVSVSDTLEGKIDAVALVRAGVAAVGGKGGGGRPDFAQGGGPDGDRADEALAAIEQAISEAVAA